MGSLQGCRAKRLTGHKNKDGCLWGYRENSGGTAAPGRTHALASRTSPPHFNRRRDSQLVARSPKARASGRLLNRSVPPAPVPQSNRQRCQSCPAESRCTSTESFHTASRSDVVGLNLAHYGEGVDGGDSVLANDCLSVEVSGDPERTSCAPLAVRAIAHTEHFGRGLYRDRRLSTGTSRCHSNAPRKDVRRARYKMPLLRRFCQRIRRHPRMAATGRTSQALSVNCTSDTNQVPSANNLK